MHRVVFWFILVFIRNMPDSVQNYNKSQQNCVKLPLKMSAYSVTVSSEIKKL